MSECESECESEWVSECKCNILMLCISNFLNLIASKSLVCKLVFRYTLICVLYMWYENIGTAVYCNISNALLQYIIHTLYIIVNMPPGVLYNGACPVLRSCKGRDVINFMLRC